MGTSGISGSDKGLSAAEGPPCNTPPPPRWLHRHSSAAAGARLKRPWAVRSGQRRRRRSGTHWFSTPAGIGSSPACLTASTNGAPDAVSRQGQALAPHDFHKATK